MMLNLLTMLQKETWNLCQILVIHITFWYYKCGIYVGDGRWTTTDILIVWWYKCTIKKGKINKLWTLISQTVLRWAIKVQI